MLSCRDRSIAGVALSGVLPGLDRVLPVSALADARKFAFRENWSVLHPTPPGFRVGIIVGNTPTRPAPGDLQPGEDHEASGAGYPTLNFRQCNAGRVCSAVGRMVPEQNKGMARRNRQNHCPEFNAKV